MRIIAGDARGRKLAAPDGIDTRPTSDRTREALMNILTPRLWDARVLDLFAGSGALALEALSRGAAFAVLNEPDAAAHACVLRNVRDMGAQARCRVLKSDYRDALRLLSGEAFSLVFLDPPYRLLDAYPDALALLRARGLLAPDARIVLEHARDLRPRLPDGFEVTDERRYGKASLLFVKEAQAT